MPKLELWQSADEWTELSGAFGCRQRHAIVVLGHFSECRVYFWGQEHEEQIQVVDCEAVADYVEALQEIHSEDIEGEKGEERGPSGRRVGHYFV